MQTVAKVYLKIGNALTDADKLVRKYPKNADVYYTRLFVLLGSANKTKASAGDACSKFRKNKTETIKKDVLITLDTVIKLLERVVSDSDKTIELNPAKYRTRAYYLPTYGIVKRDLNKWKSQKMKVVNGAYAIKRVAHNLPPKTLLDCSLTHNRLIPPDTMELRFLILLPKAY